MFALAAPAAVADDIEDEPIDTPPAEPSDTDDATEVEEGNGGYGEDCLVVVRPEKVLPNGKVLPAKTRVSAACVQERDQIREQKRLDREERAQIRDEIRDAGGSWGSYVRQEALIRVASNLAERHAQAPESAALGRILTLINYGLPEQFQLDIEAFLAQYDLVFADLIKFGGDDEDGEEPEPSPSVSPEPSPSVSPEPSPSVSPEPSPSVTSETE